MAPHRAWVCVVVIAFALALSACGVVKDRLERNLNGYVGKPISEAMLTFGPPTSQYDIAPGQKAFQWDQRGSFATPGTAARVYGTLIVNPPREVATRCLITFVAVSTGGAPQDMSSWLIQRWQYNASDMSTCQ